MGEVADFANGTISLCRGDFLDAGLSFASMIPVLGDVIGKGGKVAVKVADKANDASKIATKVDDGVKAVENVNINVTPVNEKTYQTYTKLNPKTGEVYSGRTSGNGTPEENILKRDKNHHMNKFGFGPAILDKSSSNKNAIRGQEQILINNNGGAKSFGGSSGNRINGIAPNNPKIDEYINAAKKEFNE